MEQVYRDVTDKMFAGGAKGDGLTEYVYLLRNIYIYVFLIPVQKYRLSKGSMSCHPIYKVF